MQLYSDCFRMGKNKGQTEQIQKLAERLTLCSQGGKME